MRQILFFLKYNFQDLNPWNNIKVLHTNIKGDVLSGITVAIIALPLALAFGEISQLGPLAGIWGAIVGGVIGGLFGGCLVGVSGPTAPKATQIAAFMSFFMIGTTNQPDLVAAFSIIFLSGLILIGISFLRISHFIHYIPYPVIAGFMCGIGVIVILTQLNAFVGLEAERNIHEVFKNFGHTVQNINIDALYVAIPSLLILFLWSYIEKKINFFSNVPSPLIALIVGTVIAYFMNLNIPLIGDKMHGASETDIFSFYLPDFNRIGEFVGPALALAGLAILDSLLSCKVADNMIGKQHSSDRETFGQGMANMAAGLFGGVTTATATMRTVANIKFGGKTPLASIIHGFTLLAILLGFGFLVAAIPVACLAAILFKVGIDIMDYRILPVLRKIPIKDLLVFLIVLFVTVYEDLMVAVSLGVIFSLFGSFREIKSILFSHFIHKEIPFMKSDFVPDIDNKNDLKKIPISIFQLSGPIFFGSIESLKSEYQILPKHEILVLDMGNITMIDLSGVYAIEDLITKIESRGIKVFISDLSSNVIKVLERVNSIKILDKNYNNYSKDSIVDSIIKHFNLK